MGRGGVTRLAALDKAHNAFTQIKRIGLRHHESPPARSESQTTPPRNPPRFNLRVRCSSAEFRPPPGGGRSTDNAFELAAEVIYVAEAAGLRDAGDRIVLADHKRLGGNQPLTDEPAARTFPQGLLKKPSGLRGTQSPETSYLGCAPRTADIGTHSSDDGAEWIRSVPRGRRGERTSHQEEELADELIEMEIEATVPPPQH